MVIDDLVDMVFEDMDPIACYNCNWIVQQWDFQFLGSSEDGWSTHNSEEYETEELCLIELENQSELDSHIGYRCIHEKDLDKSWAGSPEPTDERLGCIDCEWAIEQFDSPWWEPYGNTNYVNEGVCQQSLFIVKKENIFNEYRCVYVGR